MPVTCRHALPALMSHRHNPPEKSGGTFSATRRNRVKRGEMRVLVSGRVWSRDLLLLFAFGNGLATAESSLKEVFLDCTLTA